MKSTTLALALLLTAGSSASAQVRVNGRVENTDSVALAGVKVELGDSAQRVVYTAISDSLGAFTIRLAHPLPPGRFFVRSEILGYQTTSGYLSIVNLQEIELIMTMDVAAIPVEPLRVTVRKRYNRGALDEFYDRADLVRRMGGGTIVSYEQLQRRAGGNVATIITEYMPGSRNCPPSFFIDGMRVTGDDLRNTSVLDLEGIEIYRSSALIPVQYQNRAGCGAVLVWTQIGDRGEGSPLTWRRVLITIGLATTALVLFR